MGAALCLLLPYCLLVNRPRYYHRYDDVYYGCQEPVIVSFTDDKKNKKYLARCGNRPMYGSYYCRHHQYYL